MGPDYEPQFIIKPISDLSLRRVPTVIAVRSVVSEISWSVSEHLYIY